MCVIVLSVPWNRGALRRSRLKMTYCCCVRTALHLNTGEGGGSDVPDGASPRTSELHPNRILKGSLGSARLFGWKRKRPFRFGAQIDLEQQVCDGGRRSRLKVLNSVNGPVHTHISDRVGHI